MKKLIRCILAVSMALVMLVGCGNSGNTGNTGTTDSSAAGVNVDESATNATTEQNDETSIVPPVAADIKGNENPTEEEINAVLSGIDSSYLGDPYTEAIPSNYAAYPFTSNNEITVWQPLSSFLAPYVASLNDYEVYKKAQELTGIKVNFISPPVGEENDQFSIMIASGDLPDVIVEAGKYQGGLSAGVDDGAYLELTDLLDEYAPNYAEFRSSDESRRRNTISDDGRILGMYGLSPYSEWMWFGLLIKQEALDKTGLPVPETVDEWYEFLKKCQEVGYKEPLNYGSNYGQIFTGIFNGAYGVWDWVFVNEEGKADWGPASGDGKAYLETIAKWQSEGLFNADWTTADFNQRMAEAVSDDCAVMMDSPDTMWGFWKVDNDIDFVAALNPVLNKGDKSATTYRHNKMTGQETVVTAQSKNVEAALAWLDFGFTKKGWELYNWGKYGEVHLVGDDGRPYYHDNSLMYTDGEPIGSLIWKYRVHSGPNIRDEHFSNPLIVDKGSYSGDIRDFWTSGMDARYNMPAVTFTPEEASREASLGTQLDTLRREYFTKIIVGQLPVSAYDEFLQKAEQIGLEEFKGIWQNALDRYNAR